jgi:SAM-dependent methyltransferase
MRELVGPTDEAAFDNPSGAPVFDGLPAERVLDFGCGCGRIARQLIQQERPPERYVGVDLHRGMIEWCRVNLAPAAPQFRFDHHDVYNAGLNPGGRVHEAPFVVEDSSMSLVVAHSVFTHVLQDQVGFYLSEIARVLEPGGVFTGTWFTFDRSDFPMLQDFQNALYVNDRDPTNATIFDRGWIEGQAAAAGLAITKIEAPSVRGYHWYLDMRPAGDAEPVAQWPDDTAQPAAVPPPLTPAQAERIGL